MVYYFVPGDHDDVSHPNVFTITKNDNDPDRYKIRLRDIRARFPLPGNYHFRFKVKHENMALWLDVVNDDAVVPLFNSKIIAKVLRVHWDPWSNSDAAVTTKSVPGDSASDPQARIARAGYSTLPGRSVPHKSVNHPQTGSLFLDPIPTEIPSPPKSLTPTETHHAPPPPCDYVDMLLLGGSGASPTFTSQGRTKTVEKHDEANGPNVRGSWNAGLDEFFAG